MAHINIQSLSTSFNRLEYFLGNDNIDIIALTEHWKDDNQLELYNPQGYTLITKFCREHGKHGGCAIYVKDTHAMNCKQKSEYNRLSIAHVIECSALKYSVNNMKLIIICIYRPNTYPMEDVNKFFDTISEILEMLSKEKNTKFIILGDFNIDILENTKTSQTFLTILRTYNIKPSINEPTRITPSSRTCLDNILTNIEKCNISILQLHLSDHLAQCIGLPQTATDSDKWKPKTTRIRIYNEHKINVFNRQLSEIDWRELGNFSPDEVDAMWAYFSQTYHSLFERLFPYIKTTKIHKNHNNKWTEHEKIKPIKQKLDILYTISGKIPSLIDSYKKLKTYYDKTLKEIKQEYFENKIKNSTNKIRTTWQIIKDLTRNPGKTTPNFPKEHPQTLADQFNNYFINIAPNISRGIQADDTFENKTSRVEKSLYIFEVTPDEVIKTTRKMKNKNSYGYDEIPMQLISKTITTIAEPIAYIINKAFIEGKFPEALKMAWVKPIYKNGSKDDLGNYRPINMLTSFAKIFEKLLANRLISFLKKNKILSNQQHGFVNNKSTETAISELLQIILEALEEGNIPVALFLDLSKAFDCVDQQRLLEKLECYGIRDKQLQLMRSYIDHRKQKVIIKTEEQTYESREEEVHMGVVQGSILGPLLFVLYVNDLPEILKNMENSKMINYVDDTNAVTISKKKEISIEDADILLQEILKWCNANKLQLNIKKTECAIFQTDQSKLELPINIVLDNTLINLRPTIKFLGIYMDTNLKWQTHIEYLSKKLSSSIYTFKVMKNQVKMNILQILYYSNFQSLMSYGIMFWGNSSDSMRIFILQKVVIRTIFGMKYRETCRGTFKRNKILTMTGLYILKCVLFLRKHPEIFNQFKCSSNTRRMHPYIYPKYKLTLSQNSAQCMCLKLYNSLPRKLQKITQFKEFKNEVTAYVIQKEPYTLDEFLVATV